MSAACSSGCGWCGGCSAMWEDDGDENYDDGRCSDCGAGADEHCTDDCACDDCQGDEDDDDSPDTDCKLCDAYNIPGHREAAHS